MGLRMVVADTDKSYLEALEEYLITNYHQRFHLSFFSRQEFLHDFLDGNDKEIDILLINPELLAQATDTGQVKKIIQLKDGKINLDSPYPSINKYQPCDRLVGKVMDLFGETSDNKISKDEDSQTKIISIYSPVGGVGKTTVAVAMSTLLAQMGKQVLYLNLEGISTIDLYFNNGGSQCSISNLFYLAKDKKKNLSLKVEAMQIKDHATQVNYIGPAESILEWEEISEDDIQFLLTELQISGLYDYIIVDLSSCVGGKNLRVMNCSQKIMMVLNQNIVSKVKGEKFLGEMDQLPGMKANLLDKIELLMNCSFVETEMDTIGGKPVNYYLLEDQQLWILRNDQRILNTNSEFSKELYRLIHTFEK